MLPDEWNQRKALMSLTTGELIDWLTPHKYLLEKGWTKCDLFTLANTIIEVKKELK